jgi:hypothetical protein
MNDEYRARECPSIAQQCDLPRHVPGDQDLRLTVLKLLQEEIPRMPTTPVARATSKTKNIAPSSARQSPVAITPVDTRPNASRFLAASISVDWSLQSCTTRARPIVANWSQARAASDCAWPLRNSLTDSENANTEAAVTSSPA